MAKQSGNDDGALHDVNDDNLPQNSGLDDGPQHEANDVNDDKIAQHSGLDDGPQHDANDDRGQVNRGADDVLRGGAADDVTTLLVVLTGCDGFCATAVVGAALVA